MRRPEFIAKQSRCPVGFLGSAVATIMAHETVADNRNALDLLEIQPNDSVLEIGFAHGRTIAEAAARAFHGSIAGVEISQRMLRMATRFNKKSIEKRHIDLKLTDGRSIPYGDFSFDKVYSVHTLYFWLYPLESVQEIVRVLKPGGRFVLSFRPGDDPETRNFPATIYRFYTVDEAQALLRDGGFKDINIVRRKSPPEPLVFAVCAAPRKSENGTSLPTTTEAISAIRSSGIGPGPLGMAETSPGDEAP
jgi:SAM-dependent methyltransferase